MRLFFGKISKSFDIKQIVEGYYQAPKSSSWFGNINIGDYTYIIGGDKIQFWRAKEWKIIDGNDRLYFDILSSDLGITVIDFIALNFLKLNKALLVLSSRSARNKAFFELVLIDDISVENLSSPAFYQLQDIYRSIKLLPEQEIDNKSKDIQLFFDGHLKLIKADFYDQSVYELFRDNLKYAGKGAKHKDGTLSKIKKGLDKHKTLTRTDISLRAFYDTFFCDYNEKANHFLVGAFWDDHNPQDMTSLFLKEKRWANGYDEKFTKEVNDIPANAWIAIKSSYVKEKKRSVMMIKARGRVSKNHLDGQNLDVEWENDFQPFEVDFGGYMNTVKGVINKDHISTIWEIETDEIETSNMNSEYLPILKYKKQIILQGPPGTGKTRLAKELAEMLIGSTARLDKPVSITNSQIIDTLKDVQIIKTVAGNTEYKLVNVDTENEAVTLQKKTEAQDTSSFTNIRESFRTRSFLNDIVGNPNRRTSAIANYIYQNIQGERSKLENSEQFKLIQFHPSYTYEDFVRGIVAKPNPDGSGVLYEAENKILIEIAEKAIQNNLLSSNEYVKAEVTTEMLFNLFVDDLKEQIGESEEQRIGITEAVYLYEPDERRFKYKGDNWVAHKNGLNMKFSELQKIIVSGVKERIEVKNIVGLEELTKQHATYFIKVVEKFYEFKDKHELIVQNSNSKKLESKNYVLIIDEINRANLSSVLGELIYALEYRGEKVESMYKVDKENKLILPPNLYIIGTMNTADRSVGHIDYAIRRRFAFVDVLPEKLEDNNEIWFNTSAYEAVEKLFITSNVSADFDVKDIQIGHSYFIVKKEDAKPEEKEAIFKMKMKYEVIPILNEYVKDGILNLETKKLIDLLSESYT